MSAIVGIYYRDGRSLESQSLVKMLDILAHRGEDGVDTWYRDSIGLGHRLLRTTPESLLEQQPLVSSSGNQVLTADARIDNREELISSLELTNIPAEKITDSQLILAAYERWGEDCPNKLLGDFAFAIWNEQEQNLFCARDHFGVKPFYYYSSEGLFAFASEIKAILCLPEVPQELNELRIGYYLASMFRDRAITSYQNIFRLPPAHSLTVSHKQIKIESYWSLDPNKELILDSDEEYAAEFRKILTEAVRCRLRSVHPVGCTMSGGLDSSSIACTAQKLLDEQQASPLHTFSAVFDELKECDEREYIDSILKQSGLRSHFVLSDKIDPFNELGRAFWHQDEAFYAPNWSMTWALYGKAREEGVRTMLNGFDGDTTVSDGYGYLSELAKAGRWLSLARQTKELAKTYNGSFRKWYWSYIKQYALKPASKKYLFLKQSKRVAKSFLRSSKQKNFDSKPSWSAILNPQFVARINLTENYQAEKKSQSNFGQNERERHYLNINSGMPTFALEVMDKSMAAFGIEPRYPFWDKRLVEFCLALPPEQKLNLGWNRIVMRRAMKDLVPKEVRWRRGKTDFSTNLVRGLRCLDRENWDRFMSEHSAILAEYINLTVLEEIYQRFAASESLAAGQDARILWNVMSLVLWLSYVTENSSTINNKQEALSQTSQERG